MHLLCHQWLGMSWNNKAIILLWFFSFFETIRLEISSGAGWTVDAAYRLPFSNDHCLNRVRLWLERTIVVMTPFGRRLLLNTSFYPRTLGAFNNDGLFNILKRRLCSKSLPSLCPPNGSRSVNEMPCRRHKSTKTQLVDSIERRIRVNDWMLCRIRVNDFVVICLRFVPLFRRAEGPRNSIFQGTCCLNA